MRTKLFPVIALLLAVPAHAQPPVLSLADVYETARARSPRLHAARALAEARAAMVPSAGRPADPMVQLGIMNFSIPGLDANMPTSMAPSVQAMQMLPIPGKLSLSSAIARQDAAMASLDAEEAWWMVRSEAAMSFYMVYQADRQLAVMRETLGLLRDFERVARAMYGAGEGRQSDVLRAGVEVARMEADLKRMEAMRTAAAAKLNATLGLPADAAVATPAYGHLPLEVPALETLRLWSEESRPMLAKGRTGIEQAQNRSALARRELWPDPVIGVEYGQRPGGMAGETERMGSVMVGFSLPIFAKSRQLRMREETLAMERMAQADLTDMRARVDGRLAELVADLERTRTLVQLYEREVLPQARANVESSFSSYRVGAVDFMTLVDAQMTVNEYEQELYALRADYGRSIAELEMTVGRELPVTGATMAEAR